MLVKPFGADWTFNYRPQVGGEDVTPTGSPQISRFADQPSDTDARSGTGQIGSAITSWTYNAASKLATFTIPKIDDPLDGTKRKLYWLAINYNINSGTQKQLDLRTYYLTVPDGLDEEPVPQPQEIFDAYDITLQKEFNRGDCQLYIDRAVAKVKADLRWQGTSWPKVHNMAEFRTAVCYQTLKFMYWNLTDEGDEDVWSKKYGWAAEEYKTFMQNVKIIEDIDDDKVISESEEAAGEPLVYRLIR